MAIASLVLGIVAAVLMLIPGISIAAPVVGIVGIILGVLGRKQAIERGEAPGMATAGLVLSIIATAVSLIVWISCYACVKCAADKASSNLEDILRGF